MHMQGSAYILLFFSLPVWGAARGGAGEQRSVVKGRGVLLGAAPRRKYAQKNVFCPPSLPGAAEASGAGVCRRARRPRCGASGHAQFFVRAQCALWEILFESFHSCVKPDRHTNTLTEEETLFLFVQPAGCGRRCITRSRFLTGLPNRGMMPGDQHDGERRD